MNEWNTSSIANVIDKRCHDDDWFYTIRNRTFTIKKHIKKNDAAFNKAQAEGIAILKLVPTTAPSVVWGLENSHAIELAKQNGFIQLNKSSCNAQVLRQLKELVVDVRL